MLANLLPGLRDLRAPMSAGYLWLATTWLLLVPHLPRSAKEATGPIADVYSLGSGLGLSYVVAMLSFVAYLIGILSTGTLSPAIRLLVALPRRLASRARLRMFSGPANLTGRILSRLRDLVIDAATNAYSTKSEVHTAVTTRLDADTTWLALRRLHGEKVAHKVVQTRHQAANGLLYTNRLIVELSDEQRAAALSLLRPELVKEAERSSTERRELIYATVDVERHVEDLVQELRLVPEKLVGDRPAAFERWDRLDAEGEFRLAIVPPLWGLLVATIIRGLLPLPVVLILSAVVLVILWQGIQKGDEAYAQLIQSIEAGFPSSPAISRISEGDLYWRSARPEEFDLRAPGYRLAVGLATGRVDRVVAPYGFGQPAHPGPEAKPYPPPERSDGRRSGTVG